MLSRIIKYLRDRGGQSAVELAIIAPVMVMFLGGVIEFGNIIYHKEIVMQAAHQAGMAVSKTGNRYTANTAAKPFFPAGTDSSVLSTNVTPTPRNAGDQINVTVNYKVKLLTPVIAQFIPHDSEGRYNVSATSTVYLQVSR